MTAGRRAQGQQLPLNRVRVALAVLSVSAFVALVAVSAPANVRRALLDWGPPSLRPALAVRGPGAFVWGPPRMPARAQQALQTSAGARSRAQHRQRDAGAPTIRVEVNQNHDEGDRIEPININIELPGTTGAHAAAAPKQHAARAQPVAAVHQPAHGQVASLNSKAAVDEIDADGDAPAAAAAGFSPDASGADAANADAPGDDSATQEREASAEFSPADSRVTESGASSSPKLPAMWLVGSPGQPHPHHAHDGSAKGKPSAHARGGKHSHGVAKSRAQAAARVEALRMQKLSQLAESELRADHMQLAANGAVVVPLPDLKTMSGRQLVALEQGLQFEERDARDSALTMRGMDRAKLLSKQIELVHARMAKVPVEIETELARNEEQMAKKEREVQVLKNDIADEQRKLEAARKEEGPKKLRRQERTMQQKVELQRAVAGALADLKGTQSPMFSELHAPPGSDTDDADNADSVNAEEQEVKAESEDLAKAKEELATLQAKREGLLKDMVAIHGAMGNDVASDAFGNQVGREQWLKDASGADAAELAAPGRATMLSEQGSDVSKAVEGVSNAVAQNVSKTWEDYMDVTDPSKINPGDVRHAIGMGIMGGIKDAGNSTGDFMDGDWRSGGAFKTVSPLHGAHEVPTPDKVIH